MLVMSIVSLLFFQLLLGNPVLHRIEIYRNCLPWWMQSQPRIYIPGGYSCQGSAKCRHDGDNGFSLNRSAGSVIDAYL
jgi:hypothetical protein